MIQFYLFFFALARGDQPISVRTALPENRVISKVEFSGVLKKSNGNRFELVLHPQSNSAWNRLQEKCFDPKVTVRLARRLTMNAKIEQSRVFLVSKRHALSGSSAQLSVVCRGLQVSRVPLNAIVSPNGQETYLMIAENGRANRKKIEIWRLEGSSVLLFSPLKETTEVIVSGLHKIVPNDSIEMLK